MCPSPLLSSPTLPSPLSDSVNYLRNVDAAFFFLLCQYHLNQVVLWPEDWLKQKGVSYDDEE